MENYTLEDLYNGRLYEDLINELPKQVQKLINHLDYDAKELDRLYSDLSYTLEIDKDYKMSLIDKIMRRKAIKDYNKHSFRKIKFQRIKKAMEMNNIFVLAEEMCSTPSLLDARNLDADSRYELRSMAMQPSASFLRGTIEEFFNQLVTANKEMKEIANEVQEYLKTADIKGFIEEMKRACDI